MNTGILQQLHPCRPIPEISLYADDVVLFCHPAQSDTGAIKAILCLFGRCSGLQVNYAKSSATPIHCQPEDATDITRTLGCQLAELPLTYLGIPLTVNRPTAAQLQPIVTKAANMLPTWKSKLMNKAGRLAFIKSVISAIPLHQLMVRAPPKKVLRLLEKIERGFLWEGRAAANGGNCHVSWPQVCRPLSHGGLGIQNLEHTGLSLRLRWLWFARTDSERAWSGLDLQFSAEEQAMFTASTYSIVGDGQTMKFWDDLAKWPIHPRDCSMHSEASPQSKDSC
jgi:hypothetical protein